jgi:hypothetical protein
MALCRGALEVDSNSGNDKALSRRRGASDEHFKSFMRRGCSELSIWTDHQEQRVPVVRATSVHLVERVTPQIVLHLALVDISARWSADGAISPRVAPEHRECRPICGRRWPNSPSHPPTPSRLLRTLEQIVDGVFVFGRQREGRRHNIPVGDAEISHDTFRFVERDGEYRIREPAPE